MSEKATDNVHLLSDLCFIPFLRCDDKARDERAAGRHGGRSGLQCPKVAA